jgi:archaemetzincin
MKKILVISLLLVITTISFCTPKEPIVINIQPLGKVSNEYIEQVKKSVKTFYGYDCKVLHPKKITNNMLSKVTKRIDANKALRTNETNGNLLYVTEKDICHFKDKNRPEYGIFGLGKCPGNTCIVSTFRLKRGVNNKKTLERLEKVALHEIGHNLGLSHCKNDKKCMMNDARGTIKQVDYGNVWFCEKCRKQLK